MLGYAASRPVAGSRQSSPNAMLLIVSAHVALIAVVMSARMDLAPTHRAPPTIIDFFPEPAPSPQDPAKPRPRPQPATHTIDHPQPQLLPLPLGGPPVDTGGPTVDPGPIVGGGAVVTPEIPRPVATPVHRDARLLTPASELKPPYPESKLLTEQQATLTLRLAIDQRGQVVDVQSVGPADRVFLDAARRYMMARWRYQPASEDGRAIASSLIVTLRFQLDG